jgi:hypothetical protein
MVTKRGATMVEKINVIWKSYHKPDVIDRGYWDQGLLEDIFKQVEVNHHTDFDWLGETDGKGKLVSDQGAVVIINGRTHAEDADKINADIAKLKWVLFIETGDEEAIFPWRDIKHPMMKIWIMLPRMNEHNDAHFRLTQGYRPGTPELLKEIGRLDKTLDYSFIGQAFHERRQQCVDVAKQFQTVYENSSVHTTAGFGDELFTQTAYLEVLARTKIALCPSGIETPDSFRLYEALEAGCVPVVDAFSTNFKTPGFWQYLLGNDIPFPILSYWDELPALLPTLLKEYPANANKCQAWWLQKKREIKLRLLDDVKGLSV